MVPESESRSTRHHLIIAGTGRAGTSVLVKILNACGLETELSRGNGYFWDDCANAGIETVPLAGREHPYVLKSPWTYQFLDELLYRKDVRIDGLIVPIRDLREAAASRIIIELQNKLRSDPDLDERLAGWRDWALTPGGVTYSLEPIDQARILGQSLHLLLEKALEHEIPICLIKFPKFARDPMYLYRSLKEFMSSEVDSAQFEAIFRSTVSPEQIRVSSELEEPPDSQAATSTVAGAGAQLPSLEGLENVALKRELRAKRVEIAQASTEIGALRARCTELEAELAAASSKAGLLQSQQVETVDACVAAHAVNSCLPSRIEHQTLTFQPRTFSEIFLNHSRYLSDKWAQFLPIYDFELHPLVARGQPLRLLEIGVQNGGSLQIWHNYLPEGSRIYGLDIDERCRRLDFPPQVKVLIGDAGDPATLNELLGDEVFDIIIDDGSHQSRDVVAAVEALLPRLAAGGKYFIEDLHTSYWSSYGGGFRKAGTAIEHVKKLVDALHTDYFQASESIEDGERHSLIDLNAQIGRVSFYDSIAVITNYSRPKMAPFNRVLSGREIGVTGADDLLEVIAANPNEFVLSGGATDVVVSAAARKVSDLRRETHRQRADLEQRATAEAALRAEIEQRAATEAALRADIEQRAAAEAALRADIEKGAEAEAALRSALQNAERDAQTRGATAEAVKAEIAVIKDVLSKTDRSLQERAAAAEALQAEINSVRIEFEEAERRRREGEAAAAARQAEITALRIELAAARDVGKAALASLRITPAPILSSARNTGWLGVMLRRFGRSVNYPLPSAG